MSTPEPGHSVGAGQRGRSAEAEILIATARVHLHELGREHLRAGLEWGADWVAVIRAALEHGTGALLCRHLLTAAPDLLPPELRHAATAFLERRRAANSVAVAELFHMLDALGQAGVSAIPFKGAALAQAAYGDLALRDFRDLDLLIAEADIPQTMAVLTALGYRSQAEGLTARQLSAYYRYNGQDILFAEGRLPVEPHWAFAPRSLSARVDAAGVFRRAVPLSLAGRAVRSLAPEDALVVAGLHGSKEQWPRLLWIADIAELVRSHPDLDWDATLRRADEAGVRRMVLLGLGLAEQLLDALPPDPVRRMIEADLDCRRLVARVTAHLFDTSSRPGSVFELSAFGWCMREGMADRFRYVLRTITTARLQHFRMIDLPDYLTFAYPAVKVIHDYMVLPVWSGVKTLWSGRGH